jgi:hypothetical protein
LTFSPSRPAEVAALGLGAASVLVTLFSAGAAFLFGAVFALMGMYLGHRFGRRGAVLLAWVGLGFALVAGVAWMVLASQGITPADIALSR